MKKHPEFKVSAGEQILYGIYGAGASIFFVLVGTYLQMYYLTVAAVPAAALGVVFLVAKIWDGINDPIFGVIVDKLRLKGGKYLPWLRIGAFFLPITAVLMFFVPNSFSVTAKLIFLLITYMIYDTAVTLTEVPLFAITTAMTDIPEERSHIISLQKVIALIPALAVLFMSQMYQSIGWLPTVSIFALFSMFLMIPGAFKLKERVRPATDDPPKLKEVLRYMKGNKYLIIFFISAILYGITNTVGGMGTLFCKFNLGDEGLIAPLMIATFLPGIFAIFAVKALIGKVDKVYMVIASHVVTIISSVAMYFFGYNSFLPFIVLSVVRGFSQGAHTALFFLFAPDFAEYGAYKSGINAEGVAFSMQSFASKLINALTSAFGLFVLAGFGFIEGSDIQTAGGMEGIWLLTSLIPIIGCVIQTVILVFFYKLRDKHIAVMARFNHGQIGREESEALLSGAKVI